MDEELDFYMGMMMTVTTPLPACHTHTHKRATGSSSAEHLRQIFSYSLSAADKKMVTSTMKKMVGPEAE